MELNTLGIQGGLIVSCQALEHEPLHSSFIMGRLAIAAKQGGAIGIRANTAADVKEIKQQVDLPVIGIVKRNYGTNPVFITPTIQEVDELAAVGAEIIAVDATVRARPDGKTLEAFVKEIRSKYPDVLLMADISSTEEAINAEKLGFDLISTTLVGYTEETSHMKLYDEDFAVLKEIIASVHTPVVAEGNVMTPEMAARCLEVGVYCVVVGGAITRPQQITERFAAAISGISKVAPATK
ncbi:putative N-acetylmannosamine-6-phosphate 2-epimerase [Paenibacillus sp. J45TS6]|uniref:Putative N-acetylmannosamine-6-phosphate 2-epimerase n=1 Tax=Paenibacillus gallinarum TaxID=2762232 RepID=A0ABR8T6E0_9BACL|nr:MULTISPECIES: N-acetylmannosamine-6-phosphate 2-epimerase [Paenibacillus]MBD7971328.1 N-acetylmannosamine-6-phosphate 2-epimerase [Paenibacillus gallinarum]GIP46038.1 putative N-acetylmannosamine-6-phosphate 2-epimerase [Paenibacillus sp. J45TS6]